jgi:hypothetical protein
MLPAHENQTLMPGPIGFLIELYCVSESGVHYCSTAERMEERIAMDLYPQYPPSTKCRRCLHSVVSASRSAFSNNTPIPRIERRGATSEARDQSLARSLPHFEYYFVPGWGTMVLMARPRKPQFF